MNTEKFNGWIKGFCTGGLLAVLAVVPLGIAIDTMNSKEREERTAKAISAIYVPVGNGGAMQALHGRQSPERQKMYEQIRLIREINHPPVSRFAQPEEDRIAYEKHQEQLRQRYNPTPAECMQR